MSEQSPEVSIAQSIIPYNRDDDKAQYLGLRASGFTIREALRLIHKAHSTLSYWRKDSQFVDLETRLPEFRDKLALEYANLEFLRNYRLILEKDYKIIKKSLGLEKEQVLSIQEQNYLLKMRSHYTPQQLQIIETLIKAEWAGKGVFDFTEFVLTASKIEERVRLEGKVGGAVELSKVRETDD